MESRKVRKACSVYGCLVFMLFLGLVVFPAQAPGSEAEKEGKKYEQVTFYVTPPGSSGHAILWGICDLLKKHSSFVRANVEVAWGIDCLKLWHREPKRKKNGIGYIQPINIWQLQKSFGIEAKVNVLCNFMINNQFFATFDKNINTMRDFAGKRVSVGKKGSSLGTVPLLLFDELGIKDKIKISHLGFKGSKEALLDRTVDVAFLAALVMGGRAIPNPAGMEVKVQKRPFKVIGAEEEWFEAVRKNTGCPAYSIMMPAKGMGPSQPDPVLTILQPVPLFVDADVFNPKVGYEILRVLWEHAKEIGQYHAAGRLISQKGLLDFSRPMYKELSLHPGTIKFLEEKGMKSGR